jgi:hypothetical protein
VLDKKLHHHVDSDGRRVAALLESPLAVHIGWRLWPAQRQTVEELKSVRLSNGALVQEGDGVPKVLEYAALRRQIAELKNRADKLRAKEVGQVVNSIVRTMRAYDLTPEEIDAAMKSKAPTKHRGRKPGSKNKAKPAGQQPAQ